MFMTQESIENLPGISLIAGDTEMPVTAMNITGNVDGDGVVWNLTATFANPLDAPVEATFTLPLPHGGAVTGMTMTIGDRKIEADIKEREQARVEYEEAKEQGHTAALFEQDRAEIFNLSVGNIHPGESISVAIEIHDRAAIDGTEATLRMPTMIKPRYIPGSVVDADAINPPRTNTVPLRATVNINFADDAVDAMCETVPTAVVSKRAVSITNFALDCDIIVRWTIPAAIASAKWVADADDSEMGTVEVNIRVTENKDVKRRRKAVQVVFDRSGSMSNHYLNWARRITEDVIASLSDDDLIHTLTFDSVVEVLQPTEHGFMPATRTVKKGLTEAFAKVTARGGTEMTNAIYAAGVTLETLKDREDYDELDRVVLFISDGAFGDESAAIHHREKNFRNARVIAVGIGEDANGFLEVLAANGVCVFVSSAAGLAAASQKVLSRVLTAAHSQATLVAENLTHQAPSYAPDIYPNAIVTLSARMPKPVAGATITVNAVDGHVVTLPIAISSDTSTTTRWASQHIKSLDYTVMASDFGDTGIESHDTLEQQIVAASVKYKVLSKYTAWIAVDKSRTTDQVIVRKIVQPAYEADEVDSLQLSSFMFLSAPRLSRPMAIDASADIDWFDGPLGSASVSADMSYIRVSDEYLILIALLNKLLAEITAGTIRDDLWDEVTVAINDWYASGDLSALGRRDTQKVKDLFAKISTDQNKSARTQKSHVKEVLALLAKHFEEVPF